MKPRKPHFFSSILYRVKQLTEGLLLTPILMFGSDGEV